jgi:hypothetical protein
MRRKAESKIINGGRTVQGICGTELARIETGSGFRVSMFQCFKVENRGAESW